MNRTCRRGAAASGLRLALASVVAFAAAGCAKETEIKSAAEMYAEAVEMQSAADYEGAIELYGDIQASHPFGPYAQQSLLNQAHLQYLEREFDNSLSSINRFIQDYPAHDNIDYAYYLRALALRRERPDLIDRIFLSEYANRSRSEIIEAHDAFLELVRLYPDSKYAPDSLKQAGEIVDELATGELEVALHYLRRGAYGASMSRAADIVKRYPDSGNVLEPALAIIVASLVEMKAQAPLADARESLSESFPGSGYIAPAEGGAVALLEHMGLEVTRGDYVTGFLERN